MRKLCSALGAMVLGSIVLFGTFLMGMRTKHPAVQDRVRQFNKRVGNPRMLRTAGQPGAWASIVRHTGRTSHTRALRASASATAAGVASTAG